MFFFDFSLAQQTENRFLSVFRFRQEAVENGKPHDYYIPENIFYRLCMKAKNEVAEKFQAKSCSDLNKTSIPDSLGVLHETTLYNLNVLNQLAMACIDNEKS